MRTIHRLFNAHLDPVWLWPWQAGAWCPDMYALDALRHRPRFTLRHSPAMAHHDHNPGTWPRRTLADQGVHDFRIRLTAASAVDDRQLALAALQRQHPPVRAETTRGMPTLPRRVP